MFKKGFIKLGLISVFLGVLFFLAPFLYADSITYDSSFTPASGGSLDSPMSVLFDGAGNIYVLEYYTGQFKKFDSNYNQQFVIEGLNEPSAACFDSNGHIYISEEGLPCRVLRFDLDGSNQTTVIQEDNANFSGIYVDEAGDIYVGSWSGNVRKYDSSGQLITSWGDSGYIHMWGTSITSDGSGGLYVADRVNNKVCRVSSDGQTITDFITSVSEPTAITRDSGGYLFVLEGEGRVSKYNSSGTEIDSYDAFDGDAWGYVLAIDSLNRIWVGNTFWSGEIKILTQWPAPTSFSSTAIANSVALTWVNPTDSDFASVTIRRGTSTYPDTPSEGDAVVTDGSGASFRDSSLNDGTYYYSIFAKYTNAGFSGKATAYAVVDTTPPSAPSAFTASSGINIALSWTNPTTDFASVTIRRSASATPNSITDGDEVLTDSTDTSYTDSGLSPGTYYYSIFAKDTAGNVSNKATAQATAGVEAPSAFTATAVGVGAVLHWTMPSDPDLVGNGDVLIVRSETNFPQNSVDGTTVGRINIEGSGDSVSYTDSERTPGTAYYYSIFTEYWSGGNSDPVNASVAMPTLPETIIASATFSPGFNVSDLALDSSRNI